MNGWRWWLLGIVVVAAMVTASLTAPPPEWSTVVQWARARRAGLAAAWSPCPVLVGERGPGDADAWYREALRRAASVSNAAAERLEQLRGEPPAWPLTAADRALLTELAPAVAALRAGARAADGACEPDRGGSAAGPSDSADDCLALLPVTDALLVAVLDPASRPGDAVDAALDALACGVDFAARTAPLPQLLGVRVVTATVESIGDAWLDALPGTQLPRLAEALAHADAALRPVSALPAATAVELVELLASGVPLQPYHLGMPGVWAAWRQGFSVHRSGVARAAVLVAAVQRFEQQVPLEAAWASREARLEELVAADRAHNPDLFMSFLGAVAEGERSRRRALATLRVLRLAVALASGAPPPQLADPLTDEPLLAVPSGPRVRCSAPSGVAERFVTPQPR